MCRAKGGPQWSCDTLEKKCDLKKHKLAPNSRDEVNYSNSVFLQRRSMGRVGVRPEARMDASEALCDGELPKERRPR